MTIRDTWSICENEFKELGHENHDHMVVVVVVGGRGFDSSDKELFYLIKLHEKGSKPWQNSKSMTNELYLLRNVRAEKVASSTSSISPARYVHTYICNP